MNSNGPKIPQENLPQYIDSLMARVAYLNQLRVGSIGVFFAIAAALFATTQLRSTEEPLPPSQLAVLSLALLAVGLLIYLFDLRCRARASAVAQSIRARLTGAENRPRRDRITFRESLDEDAFFSLILMLVNGLLAAATVSFLRAVLVGPTSLRIELLSLVVVVSAQYVVYWKLWPRLAARRMDELPDDSLLHGDEVDHERDE